MELWPEGRACRHDAALLGGIAIGVLLMGWTLWAGS
jgi:ZIP family zinc transporter